MHEFDTSDDDRGTRNLQAEIDQAIAGSPNEEHAGRLMRAFTAWQAIVDYKKTETKRLSEKLAARIAQFNEAVAGPRGDPRREEGRHRRAARAGQDVGPEDQGPHRRGQEHAAVPLSVVGG
jgi:hypothetical protein